MGLLSKRPASGKIQKEVTILNKLGLHARPAAMFVRAANKHRAEIWVEKEGEQVNGKSIMGLMLLAAGCLLAGLTPAQALWACTAGGARALHLDDRGAIKQGLRADLVLFAARDVAHLPYHAGVEHARLVVSAGAVTSRTTISTESCM